MQDLELLGEHFVFLNFKDYKEGCSYFHVQP